MDKAEFVRVLEAELVKTRATVVDLKGMSGPVAPDVAMGRISRMDAINNKAVNDSALRKAQEKLGQLERMVGQVDREGFYTRRKCGAQIPVQRLLLMQHSTHCVKCAA